MIFDMNADLITSPEVIAMSDWPNTPLAIIPVREEVILGGRRTPSVSVEGRSDAYEPPDLHIPPGLPGGP